MWRVQSLPPLAFSHASPRVDERDASAGEGVKKKWEAAMEDNGSLIENKEVHWNMSCMLPTSVWTT